MADGKRRLAAAVKAKTATPETTLRTGVVVGIPEPGYVDLEVPSEGGAVVVEGARHASSISPQIGHQVTYEMNGTEPVVVSESGEDHDPVFDGRVVARSFHAVPGENALELLAAAGDPWVGWEATGGALSVDSGVLELALGSATAGTLRSPIVPVSKSGRHYTGWVAMPDAGINSRAWVELIATDGLGDVVTSWGSFVDAVRLPGETIARYPTPDANQFLDGRVVGLQMVVHCDAGTAGAMTLTGAYLGTAPVFEGGAVILGRTQIDQAGIRLDGENLLAPWTTTVYDGPTHLGYLELGGANWTVRHRRIGKVGFVECVGLVAGATAWTVPTALPLPYASAAGSLSLLHGYVLDNGVRYYPVTASVEVGGAVVRRIFHPESGNGGVVDDANPFALGAGDQIRLAGSYEID